MGTVGMLKWNGMGTHLEGTGRHWKIFMALRCWIDHTMITPAHEPDAKKVAVCMCVCVCVCV